MSNEDLRQLEASIHVPEIWIVTRDLTFDSSDVGKSFRAVITKNIRARQIVYKYIVPSTLGIASVNSVLADLPRDLITVDRIPDASWPALPLSAGAIIIYNPNAEPESDLCVAYFEYPVRDVLCWGRVETRMAIEWADQIRGLLPGSRA